MFLGASLLLGFWEIKINFRLSVLWNKLLFLKLNKFFFEKLIMQYKSENLEGFQFCFEWTISRENRPS